MPDEHSSNDTPKASARTTHPLADRAARARMGGAQRWRTAEHHAGYFLPYLKSGMQLLDVGCGPGAITRGLAARVAPGRTLGVDLRRAQLPDAHGADGEASPRFAVADVLRLPFEGACFDAAHAHALFQHLADPVGAMRELHRVLRPGGVVGAADWDRELAFPHPAPELLARALSWLTVLREQDAATHVQAVSSRR